MRLRGRKGSCGFANDDDGRRTDEIVFLVALLLLGGGVNFIYATLKSLGAEGPNYVKKKKERKGEREILHSLKYFLSLSLKSLLAPQVGKPTCLQAALSCFWLMESISSEVLTVGVL
jgi:hypothetical protein